TMLLILSIFYIAIFVLSSLLLNESSKHRLSPLVTISLLTVALSIGLLSTVAATTLFTTRLSLISAEFHTHSDDFISDGNTFQTCVSKHYALIHSKIMNVFRKVRQAFSVWLSLHVILTLIQFYLFLTNLIALINSTRSLPQDPIQLLLLISRDLLLPFSIPISRLVFSLATVHRLHLSSQRFTDALVSLLCTENKMINDQTYLVCMTYASHLQSTEDRHLFLFGFLLRRDLLFKVIITSLLFMYLTYFYNR
ncbi:hypothetical protein PFISCL1PPCAC_10784, partial [Pristionchus fissidentatus]